MSMGEKAREFDSNGEHRREIDNARELLREFRKKYPFEDDAQSISNLTSENLYTKENPDCFFKWIQFKLGPLGRIAVGSDTVYLNACEQLEDFRDLLRIVVDDEKSLAQKVDAPWQRISGFGGDRHVAKKIISCYDDDVLPIFKTADLEYFFRLLAGIDKFPSNYDNMSLGEKYQFLNQYIINIKESFDETRGWHNAYFSRFLYETYPPPREPGKWGTPRQPKPLNELGLLFEPQSHEEVMFLFSKLHEKIGFPYITKIQKEFPDVFAIDNDRVVRTIEIETYSSQFDHPPEGCNFIVCWENDTEPIPEGWPKVIQLKDYI